MPRHLKVRGITRCKANGCLLLCNIQRYIKLVIISRAIIPNLRPDEGQKRNVGIHCFYCCTPTDWILRCHHSTMRPQVLPSFPSPWMPFVTGACLSTLTLWDVYKMRTVELCMCAPCALQLLLFGKFHQFYLLFLFSGFLVSVYTFLCKKVSTDRI